MSQQKSFWSTIPGILTGIAAVVTAIGGLLAILFQAGIIGSREEIVTISLPDPAEPTLAILAAPEPKKPNCDSDTNTFHL